MKMITKLHFGTSTRPILNWTANSIQPATFTVSPAPLSEFSLSGRDSDEVIGQFRRQQQLNVFYHKA